MSEFTIKDYLAMMVPCEPRKVVDLTKYLADPNYKPKSLWDRMVELKRLSKIDKDVKKYWDKMRERKRSRR